MTRGVTRHSSHETRLGSWERDEMRFLAFIFILFFYKENLNDEIYREK